MQTDDKKIYGLIGYPLGHSFSKSYFNEKFAREEIGFDAEYVNFEIPSIDQLPDVLVSTPGISGLNVTIPYKESVKTYLNSLDPTAEEIGAVNVIKIIRDEDGVIKRLKGYNSDCIGFNESIKPLLKDWHKSALVLGTGGASKAVAYALRQLGLKVNIVSRTPKPGVITYEDLKTDETILNDNLVIVNTTPLGMYPKVDACPDIPYERLTAKHLCYDVVYNPETTKFMEESAKHGATVKNGKEMLILQAEAAWAIWNS